MDFDDRLTEGGDRRGMSDGWRADSRLSGRANGVCGRPTTGTTSEHARQAVY